MLDFEKFFKKTIDKPWNWHYLSQNNNITWEIVQQNPDKPWSWDEIILNPNITMEIIQQNTDKPWRWDLLSTNPNITFDIINQNLDKPWDWDYLSTNPFTGEKEAYESRQRCKKRTNSIHEELVMKLLCPRRLQRHLAHDWDLDDFQTLNNLKINLRFWILMNRFKYTTILYLLIDNSSNHVIHKNIQD